MYVKWLEFESHWQWINISISNTILRRWTKKIIPSDLFWYMIVLSCQFVYKCKQTHTHKKQHLNGSAKSRYTWEKLKIENTTKYVLNIQQKQIKWTKYNKLQPLFAFTFLFWTNFVYISLTTLKSVNKWH